MSKLDGKPLPTQEKLHELFEYQNGQLIWRVARRRIRKGAIAGCLKNTGYTHICVDGVLYLLHRLIWVYHGKDIPPGYVLDHLDSDKSNNRIENLQLVTNKQNIRKQNIKSNNTSGFRGVYWNKSAGKWHCQITVNDKKIHLGFFTDPEEAARAYDEAAKKYYGEFANTNFPTKKAG